MSEPRTEFSAEAAVKFVEAIADGLRANGLEMSITKKSPDVLAHSESFESEELPGCLINVIIH